MEERLDRLEARCDELEKTLTALAARVNVLAPAQAAAAEPNPAAVLPSPPSPSDVDASPLLSSLTDLGRSLLVLGGAFLIRALTDSGSVPRGAGIALGLAYAVGWIVMADRIGGRGRRLSATLFGATAVLIASPLAVEAATRFNAIDARASSGIIAAFAGLALLVAVRRELAALAWVASLSAIGALAVLFPTPSAAMPAAIGLLAIGVLTDRLADGARPWGGPRWPAAAAADGVVLLLAWLAARPGGPPEPYASLSPRVALFIALALPVAYVGSAALRTLLRSRDVSAFDAAQSVASLLIGLGAAAALAGASSSGALAIGAAGLLLAGACYAAASALADRPRNFRFYAYLGLGLALYAGRLLFAGGLAAAFWAALGVAAALISVRRTSRTLQIHAAVYLAAAAMASGLAAAPSAAFLGVPPGGAPLSPWAAAALGASVAASFALVAAGGSPVPRLVTASLALGGAGTLAVFLAVRLATDGQDPGWIAAVRTGVLALSAILLAALWRAKSLPEVRWLAWAVLAAGALKILLQDVPQGRAASLVAAVVFYGLALMLAPRWLKTR